MGQLTIYLPDAVERQVRQRARRARKSVSAYIASLEQSDQQHPTDANGHPVDLAELWGSVPDLKPVPDLPPEIPTLAASIPARHRRVHRLSRRR